MEFALPSAWFVKPADELAQQLIGKRLATLLDGRLTSGRIVETEAYLPKGDSASHAARGRTPGNAAMFGPAGSAYVYPIHSRVCFNVVCGASGEGTAVLIRALQPLDGIAAMLIRRGNVRLRDLCRGPARLCEALGITRDHDGTFLVHGPPLWIDDFDSHQPLANPVRRTRRIGVTSARHRLLRFVVAESPWTSSSNVTAASSRSVRANR